MIATGIIRRIDDLGRVVIPKEVRRNLRIKEGDPLEIFYTKEGEVVFKKYNYADEHDWTKAKAIVKALYPDLQFALYNHWGDKETATNVNFPQSIEFADSNDREIRNNEADVVGYIEIDNEILTKDLKKIIKVLKEFFSDF
jgi:stage V sporulation protein T